ncbi:hypothetical protein ACH474_25745 [Nocardia rhamnosiphila]|uniref:hypothetical protein n=1 Tax=Nocardia rhamnosiphila TaxID=426716 RepID=UPI0037AF8921
MAPTISPRSIIRFVERNPPDHFGLVDIRPGVGEVGAVGKIDVFGVVERADGGRGKQRIFQHA